MVGGRALVAGCDAAAAYEGVWAFGGAWGVLQRLETVVQAWGVDFGAGRESSQSKMKVRASRACWEEEGVGSGLESTTMGAADVPAGVVQATTGAEDGADRGGRSSRIRF